MNRTIRSKNRLYLLRLKQFYKFLTTDKRHGSKFSDLMDAIQALLDAANYLDSRSSTVVLPRDVIDSAGCQTSFIPVPQLQQVSNTVSISPVNLKSHSGNDDVQAIRRSGGAGTREVHNKLEKHRRAHLKECFAILNNLIPTRESRKQCNHSILLGAIAHIKKLEENYDLLCMDREKEVFQQRSLQNELNHILNTSDSMANLLANVSSPSTDTASDVSDEASNPYKAVALLPSDPIPTQCPDVTSTAHPPNTILLYPVVDQKTTCIQGTVIIPTPISFTQPLKSTDSASSTLASATSAALSALLPASLLTVNPVSSVSKLSPSTQSSQTCSGLLKNLGQRSMVAWVSSEVMPATSQPGNPRMAVQMLQQTLAQRAIEQQKKQSQMLSQNRPRAQASQRGSSAVKKVKMLQPAAVAPSHNSAAFSSPIPLSLPLSPDLQTSPSSSSLAMNTSALYSGAHVVTHVPRHVVPTASLPGTSLAAGTSPVFSSLQLVSSNQIGLQARSLNDTAQLRGQQTSISVIHFVNSVPIDPSTIPFLTSDTSYRQQVLATLVPAPVLASSVEHPTSQAVIFAAENITPVSCPSAQP